MLIRNSNNMFCLYRRHLIQRIFWSNTKFSSKTMTNFWNWVKYYLNLQLTWNIWNIYQSWSWFGFGLWFFLILFSIGLLININVIRLMWIPQFVSPKNFNLSHQTLVAKASSSEVQMLLHSASLWDCQNNYCLHINGYVRLVGLL